MTRTSFGLALRRIAWLAVAVATGIYGAASMFLAILSSSPTLNGYNLWYALGFSIGGIVLVVIALFSFLTFIRSFNPR